MSLVLEEVTEGRLEWPEVIHLVMKVTRVVFSVSCQDPFNYKTTVLLLISCHLSFGSCLIHVIPTSSLGSLPLILEFPEPFQ